MVLDSECMLKVEKEVDEHRNDALTDIYMHTHTRCLCKCAAFSKFP